MVFDVFRDLKRVGVSIWFLIKKGGVKNVKNLWSIFHPFWQTRATARPYQLCHFFDHFLIIFWSLFWSFFDHFFVTWKIIFTLCKIYFHNLEIYFLSQKFIFLNSHFYKSANRDSHFLQICKLQFTLLQILQTHDLHFPTFSNLWKLKIDAP